MTYKDATPEAAAAFVAAVQARNKDAAKQLVETTYPEALWGSTLRTLSGKDQAWAQKDVFGVILTTESRRTRTRKAAHAAPARSLEQTHGHCAEVLMKDYGIQKEYRAEICALIQDIWRQGSMIHSVIIQSIQGYIPETEHRTMTLRNYLERRRTKAPPKYYKR